MDPNSDILAVFQPITLEEMSTVKLMNRIDTKYMVARSVLPEILKSLKDNYFVQENVGKRIANYHTLYYDTEDVQMYLAHHDRTLTRQKLRARIYCETGIAFCEIKNKNNKKRTQKKRIPISINDFGKMLTNDEIRTYVSNEVRYDVNTLIPQVENTFQRITLVNKEKSERLTIDLNIHFFNHNTGKDAEITELVIIELKQDGNVPSFFKKTLRDFRIKRKRISKYCLGTILTNPSAENNRFKRKLRYINKITNPTTL